MTRLLVVLLVLATGVATVAPVPKALKKAKPDPTRIPLLVALERAERHTRMVFLSRLPAGEIEIDWPWATGEAPPAVELFAALNEQLGPHGYAVTWKTQSFSLRAIGK